MGDCPLDVKTGRVQGDRVLWRRRVGGTGGGIFCWLAVFRDVLSIPGYYDDALSWACIFDRLQKMAISGLDWTFVVTGAVFFLFAFAPQAAIDRISFKRRKEFHILESVPSEKPLTLPKPPEITPRGSEDFSLEVRPSVTASYYGYGWIRGNGVTRSRMFHLRWIGEHRIRSGDVATIKVAELSGSYPRRLVVWGEKS